VNGILTEIAIIGAGPAGAYCALSLAKEGYRPLILDHSHPREKPCGGGLSPFAQKAFPFLKELPYSHGETNQIEVFYAHDRSVTLVLKNKFIITSRSKLDEHILNMAVSNGAQLKREKVLEAKRYREGWKINTNKRTYKVTMLIGADGVNSLARKATVGAFHRLDLGMCYGYLAKPSGEQRILLRFLPQRRGYIWIFPRGDHLCVGIAAELTRSKGLKTELDRFVRAHYPNLQIGTQWSALIPTLRFQTLQRQIAGYNWMLIGDAAGHVDPVSGEGIPYALRSAELASEAFAQNSPVLYDDLWRGDYGAFLMRSARLKSLIFNRYFCTPYFILASLMSEYLAI
jgi:geranylgeranyl reductase family protein